MWMVTNVEYSESDKEAVKRVVKLGSIADEKILQIVERDFMGLCPMDPCYSLTFGNGC